MKRRGPRGHRGLVLFGAALLGGCVARRSSGAQCSSNSDCLEPLVCAVGFCRGQCMADRDCAARQACVNSATDPQHNVCVPLDQPSLCASVTCLATQTCVGGHCEFPCTTDRECAPTLGPAGRCTDSHYCVVVPSSLPDGGAPDASLAEVGADAVSTPDGGAQCNPARATVAPSSGGTCAGGATLCGSACVDTATDSASCGRCGAACAGGAPCEGGSCRSYRVGSPAVTEYVAGALRHGAMEGVLLWGNASDAALGSATSFQDSPLPLPGFPSPVLDLALGYRNGCVVAGVDGRVLCWGHGFLPLRDGAAATGDLPTPTEVALPGPAVRVTVGSSAGAPAACALLASGEVRCWGSNEAGQLGDNFSGTPSFVRAPVAVSFGGAPVAMAEVSLGDRFGCAREASAAGAVWCWGLNDNGRLGRASAVAQQSPGRVTSQPGPAVSVRAFEGHACFATSAGEVYCWGQNDLGQALPLTRVDGDRPTLVPLPAGERAVQVHSGGWNSCALTCAGRLYCWGTNGWGQLGPAHPPDGVMSPLYGVTRVTGPGGVPEDLVEVGLGTRGLCALRVDGGFLCWGAVPQPRPGPELTGLQVPQWP